MGDGIINLRGGTTYWSLGSHAVLASYIRGIARKRWALKGDSRSGDPDFDVPKGKYCRTNYCQNNHEVDEQRVLDFATDVLDMVPNVVERVVEVEKVVTIEVEKGYVATIEKVEVLSFALTRELRLTQHALRLAYHATDIDESLALAARERIVREVMADLGVEEADGPSPTWYMPIYEVAEREETPQMQLELV